MSRRRHPRVYHEQVPTVLQSAAPGSLAGLSRGYAPIVDDSDYEAFASGTVGAIVVSAEPARADLFAYDTQTLPGDGAQDLDPLSRVPIPESVHVSIGGAPQVNGTDFTVADDVVSLVTTHGLTGMVVDVKFAYLSEITDDTETG